MALPFTFGTQTGTIPLNELDQNFQYLETLVPALAVAAGTVITASQPNITSVGTLSSLNCTGTVTAGTVTAGIINGTLSVGSQPNITEIGTLANLVVTNTLLAGTVTATTVGTPGGSLIGTITTPVQPNITSVGTLNGLAVAGPITGTLATAAQPNITAVGTLGTLSVSGAISAASLSTTGGISASSVTAVIGISGTILTAAQPNITSVGTLSSLAVSGAITGTLATAAQPNITSVGTLSSLAVSGAITGTLATAAQPNVTSLGTLTSLAVSGNITGGNLTGTNVVSTTITGSLSTSAQPNITAVGTLSSLSVSGTSTLAGTVTAPTAANGTSSTQVATTAFVANSLSNVLPSGVIVMWSGSVASVPAGWFLCDGTNSTPDLRDRFVVGAGSTYNPAATGGSANAIVVSHTHTATSAVTDPGHRHSYTAPSGTDTGGSFGSNVVDTTVSALTANAFTGITVATTIASAGASGINANLPPYYALAYIMKA